MMRKIELSISQLNLVLEKLPDVNELLLKNNTSISLNLKDRDVEIIINRLSDLFSEIGLQTDSEPNELGYLIEHTIDDFNRGLDK